MIEIKSAKELNRLRRLALAAQGLLQPQAYGRGIAGARKAINHIGYVQIDTISVVERAHHHVLHARVPNFTPAMTNQLLLNGDIFEYWSHAAAFLPIADFRFSLPYKHAIKSGQVHWYKNPDKKLMAELLTRIRVDGPLRSRDIETKTTKQKGWWDWKPAKKALEQLYMQGDLMVSDRESFQKTYDLTERVLPSKVDTKLPSIKQLATHLLDQQLRCHGFASLKGISYQRRNSELRKNIKDLVTERVAQGHLEQVQVSSGEVFIIQAGGLEKTLTRLNNTMKILSPFDNSVIQRDRLKALFDYDYKIECYVPEAKRVYGYFSLPLLYRGEFIGRMDCKAHRKIRHLEIKLLHLEPHAFEGDAIIKSFTSAIRKFIKFQQCDTVSLIKVEPKKLSKRFKESLKALG